MPHCIQVVQIKPKIQQPEIKKNCKEDTIVRLQNNDQKNLIKTKHACCNHRSNLTSVSGRQHYCNAIFSTFFLLFFWFAFFTFFLILMYVAQIDVYYLWLYYFAISGFQQIKTYYTVVSTYKLLLTNKLFLCICCEEIGTQNVLYKGWMYTRPFLQYYIPWNDKPDLSFC